MAKNDGLLLAVKEILFLEWDPIGVKGNDLCRNEYDNYAASIARLLRAGADEFKISARLRQFQEVAMGMSVRDEELHHRVARRLLDLVK